MVTAPPGRQSSAGYSASTRSAIFTVGADMGVRREHSIYRPLQRLTFQNGWIEYENSTEATNPRHLAIGGSYLVPGRRLGVGRAR
jgi:hypothetical protein